mgnify:CR=1 FL=1
MFNFRHEELYRQGRSNQRSIARELFAYIARYRFDYSGVKIAQYLKKTDSAISRMISRFECNDKKDKLVYDLTVLINCNEDVCNP